MVWDTLEFGNRFHFIKETCGARIQVEETIQELCRMADPTEHEHHVECPIHKKHVVKIKGTSLVLLFMIHGPNDPVKDYRNCIELINILDPKKI